MVVGCLREMKVERIDGMGGVGRAVERGVKMNSELDYQHVTLRPEVSPNRMRRKGCKNRVVKYLPRRGKS